MIFGIGIDIIEVERINKQIMKETGFIEKIFTIKEREYCESHKNKAQNYAARFAAKEAFFKAAGTGWRGGMAFHEVEVINDELGKPRLNLYGKTRRFIESQGITNLHVSLSHIRDMASSIVIIEK
ncbi:MAG: holo-ACP synthase [Candidatus Aminicenantes bacterium]|nr:holo-ACP synthase [Candidatus Aminicenantes bacterium]